MGDDLLFASQMTRFTDYFGNTSNSADATYTFAPSLSQMPTNPFVSDGSRITVISGNADPASAVDGVTGWIYKPETLEFYANSTEYGPGGKRW